MEDSTLSLYCQILHFHDLPRHSSLRTQINKERIKRKLLIHHKPNQLNLKELINFKQHHLVHNNKTYLNHGKMSLWKTTEINQTLLEEKRLIVVIPMQL